MKKINLMLLLVLGALSGILIAQETEKVLALNDAKYTLSNDVEPLTIKPASHVEALKIKEFGKEYFPFDTEKIYHFNSNLGDTEAIFESFEDGVTLTFDAPSMEYRQTLVKEADGVFIKRTEMSAFLFFGNDIKYVEPVLRVPFPLKDGDSWEWHALETEGDDTTKLVIRGEVLGQEKVFTPYGEFDCVKIRQHVKSENGSDNMLTEWFAPKVGLVKSHAVLEGTGITGFIQSVLGYDEVTFELAAIKNQDEE
jgi:hypothetical protein